MPIVTLKFLKSAVYDLLEKNSVFYTEGEVTSAINEAICIINIETGLLQSSQTIYTTANRTIYDVPQGISLPLRVSFEKKFIDNYSNVSLGQSEPEWMQQRSSRQGHPPSRCVGIGISKFALNPAESYGGRAIEVVGVIEPTPLVDDDDAMQLPDDMHYMVANYAAHVLMFDTGGGEFQQSLPLYESFEKDISDQIVYRNAKTRTASQTQKVRS